MIDESSDAHSRAPVADIWFVAVAASAGGLKALTELLSALPSDFNAAVAIVQHRVPEKETHLQWILSRHATLPVTMASDGLAVQARERVPRIVEKSPYCDGTRPFLARGWRAGSWSSLGRESAVRIRSACV